MGLAIFVGAIFIGWLMWSNKAQKETFLGLSWALMILAILAESIYRAIIY